ncbi:MAG: hypothetical protein HQ559_09355 [Lentisphaerae bacterium]|nr:hypothetical protein [Lentisphaerota bacterium]
MKRIKQWLIRLRRYWVEDDGCGASAPSNIAGDASRQRACQFVGGHPNRLFHSEFRCDVRQLLCRRFLALVVCCGFEPAGLLSEIPIPWHEQTQNGTAGDLLQQVDDFGADAVEQSPTISNLFVLQLLWQSSPVTLGQNSVELVSEPGGSRFGNHNSGVGIAPARLPRKLTFVGFIDIYQKVLSLPFICGAFSISRVTLRLSLFLGLVRHSLHIEKK